MNVLLTGHYKNIFKNGKCFNSRHGNLHENKYVKFVTLKDEFFKLGVNLFSSDYIPNNNNYDALIVHDHPTDFITLNKIKNFLRPKYLTMDEAPFILPNSFQSERSTEYRFVFSNYIKDSCAPNTLFVFPHHIDTKIALSNRINDIQLGLKDKIVFVGTNKKPNEKLFPNSNYYLRDNLFYWYLINDPNWLDIYGANWTRYFMSGHSLISKVFNYHKFDNILLNTDKNLIPLYRGKLKSKYYSLSSYKYQFCLENCFGYEGYVTEKIFDAIICRNLPVYYPSTKTSIKDIIPSNLYINMYDFKNFKDLNLYLKCMTINEYTDYINRIDNFIDNLPQLLFENNWAKVVSNAIYNDLLSYKNFYL